MLKKIPDTHKYFVYWRGYTTFGLDKSYMDNIKLDIQFKINKEIKNKKWFIIFLFFIIYYNILAIMSSESYDYLVAMIRRVIYSDKPTKQELKLKEIIEENEREIKQLLP